MIGHMPTIRALQTADLPAFVALRNEMLRLHPDAFTSDYETERHKSPESFASRLGEPESGHCIWGAFEETAPHQPLLGTIAMERDRDTRPQKRHIAHVTAVMVHPRAQGHGIASKLIANCIDFARANAEIDQLILTVTASNEHVVRLYERAGFVPYGLLPRAICVQGQYFDKLHMRLDLTVSRQQHPRQFMERIQTVSGHLPS
jgi:ribosomal protein S18 acetylase RimI-like enzyme